MKKTNFKYYPFRKLFLMTCLVIVIYLIIKYGVLILFNKTDFTNISAVNLIMDIAGLSSILALVFSLINEYIMWNWYLKFLGLPDLRGKYTGELVSNYHIEDDITKPNITKWIEMEIHQNINGFHVKANFYPSQYNKSETSESESITHDILAKDNGEFVITYHYRNKGNKFHKENERYKHNNHDGIAILTFDPKNKILKGNYFNDGQERESYGKLNLIKA
ncbi:Cap15 family cyclic dinucleotide receptor domain-containing protein [Chryseobacterium binzhouense]|uniref:Cap15 family cyclic dinucleotide receptor domain-containing protein n=1 Tax=Chryseobacterium binzhouense TaxID=2593646 RepID=UPI00117DF0E5|nr:hypothetical protein [Chryseobacterium binzhouense]